MLSYAALCRHPAAFPSLTGVTRSEFESLAAQFERAVQQARDGSTTTRRSHAPRCNAPGAGRPHDHGPHDRLLMALVWLRIYPTYEALGFFFELHKRNAQLNVRAALEVLDTLHDLPFDRPTRDRTKLRSAAEVMTAFPQVRVVIDGKEQRTNRPTGYDAQKPYYSGGVGPGLRLVGVGLSWSVANLLPQFAPSARLDSQWRNAGCHLSNSLP